MLLTPLAVSVPCRQKRWDEALERPPLNYQEFFDEDVEDPAEAADPDDQFHDEELDELPWAVKQHDPLLGVRICHNGVAGFVQDMDRGRVSRTNLYCIRYDDGDYEHVTLEVAVELLHDFRLRGVFPPR